MPLSMMRFRIAIDRNPAKIGFNSSTSSIANKGITYMAFRARPLNGIFFVIGKRQSL